MNTNSDIQEYGPFKSCICFCFFKCTRPLPSLRVGAFDKGLCVHSNVPEVTLPRGPDLWLIEHRVWRNVYTRVILISFLLYNIHKPHACEYNQHLYARAQP